jgi:hypothetical protein
MPVLKILKTGETDIDSTDISKFAVHSDYPAQKIYASGSTTITIPSGGLAGSVTINHALGYSPSVTAMFEISGGRYIKVNGQKNVYRPDDEPSIYSIKVSTTSVTFQSIASFATLAASSNVSITVYYIIFYEEI